MLLYIYQAKVNLSRDLKCGAFLEDRIHYLKLIW